MLSLQKGVVLILFIYFVLIWNELLDLEDYYKSLGSHLHQKVERRDLLRRKNSVLDWFNETNNENMDGKNLLVPPDIKWIDDFDAANDDVLKLSCKEKFQAIKRTKIIIIELEKLAYGFLQLIFVDNLIKKYFPGFIYFSSFTESLLYQNFELSCPLLDAPSNLECEQIEDNFANFFKEENVKERLRSCSSYFKKIATVSEAEITKSEVELPLAFSIITHGNLGILEAILASIFRPHNAYCIFVDTKAPEDFLDSVSDLISCYKAKFPDSIIFIPENRIPIFWSDFSLLEADLICIELLLEHHAQWKYYINQAGTAMPTVSIWKLVEILKHLNGKDSIRSRPFPQKYIDRIKFVYKSPNLKINSKSGVQQDLSNNELQMNDLTPKKTYKKKEKPPFNLTIFKGLKESVISRKSADFFVHSEVAKSFKNWCRDVIFPEEIFFQTLCRIDQELYRATSLVKQDKNEALDMNRGLCIRRTLWEDTVKKCYGKMRRYICNVSILDFPEVFQKKCLFVNKFSSTVDIVGLACLHYHVVNSSNQ